MRGALPVRPFGDPALPLGRPAWWGVVLVLIALPTAVAIASQGGFQLDHSIVLVSLGLAMQPIIGPLLCAAVTIPWIGAMLSNRFASMTRTREPIAALLARQGAFAVIPAALIALLATALLGVYAFAVAPALGIAPADDAAGWTSYEGSHSAAQDSTLSQLLAIGPALYIGAMAALQAGWAAVFAAASLVTLWLTGNRLIALTLPLILMWAENLALSTVWLEGYRTVDSVDPMLVAQQPMWTVLVPFSWWLPLLGVALAVAIARRDKLPGML